MYLSIHSNNASLPAYVCDFFIDQCKLNAGVLSDT